MNKLYFFIFTLFLIPFIVYAQGEVAHSDAEELYNETQLEPIENSPYTAEFFGVTKNNAGDLGPRGSNPESIKEVWTTNSITNSQYQVWDEMVLGKQVTTTDVKHMIKKNT